MVFTLGPVVEYAGHYVQGNSYFEDVIELLSWPWFIAGLLVTALSVGLNNRVELARRIASLLLLILSLACFLYGFYYAYDNHFRFTTTALFLAFAIIQGGLFGSIYLLIVGQHVRRECHPLVSSSSDMSQEMGQGKS